jgi:hypothetical protein
MKKKIKCETNVVGVSEPENLGNENLNPESGSVIKRCDPETRSASENAEFPNILQPGSVFNNYVFHFKP